MKNISLLLLLLLFSVGLQAKRIAVITAAHHIDDTDCWIYAVTIFEDGGNTDPLGDYVVAKGYVMGNGCDLDDIADPPVSTTASAIVADEWSSGGCDYFEVNVNDDGELSASGIIDTCTTPQSLGIGLSDGNSKLKAYPTSTTDFISLDSPVAMERVHVLSASGHRVMTREITGAYQYTLSVAGLSDGVYILIIEGENLKHVSKFTKL